MLLEQWKVLLLACQQFISLGTVVTLSLELNTENGAARNTAGLYQDGYPREDEHVTAAVYSREPDCVLRCAANAEECSHVRKNQAMEKVQGPSPCLSVRGGKGTTSCNNPQR